MKRLENLTEAERALYLDAALRERASRCEVFKYDASENLVGKVEPPDDGWSLGLHPDGGQLVMGQEGIDTLDLADGERIAVDFLVQVQELDDWVACRVFYGVPKAVQS